MILVKYLPYGKCELWNLMLLHQVKWNKSPHARRHFTLQSNISHAKRSSQIPKGIYFVEKRKDTLSRVFLFLEVPARFVCIFLLIAKKNIGSPPSSRRRQLSTGQLHLSFQICPSLISPKIKRPVETGRFVLEVPARFELANESFADSCLTTWPRYHMK